MNDTIIPIQNREIESDFIFWLFRFHPQISCDLLVLDLDTVGQNKNNHSCRFNTTNLLDGDPGITKIRNKK
jgi:hypothetical protein